MTYLHYNFSDETLALIRERYSRRAEIAEAMYDNLGKRIDRYWPRKAPASLHREMRDEYRKAVRASDAAERVEEEIEWRENRDTVVADYARAGYVLRFICDSGTGEFETEEEALAEAEFQHALNDVYREIGPDGSWIDDMIPPEEMVQAVFVLKEVCG